MMMMFFSGLLALVLVVSAAEGGVGPSTNSSFCTESKECLDYELVCKTDEYEVRHYSPTRWVSTDAEAYFMGVGAAMAFRRLFQYITGANEGVIQMEMTAPVLVKIPEETKMWEPAIYTLNFLLPAAYQDKPPTPTNDKLYFTDMPEMDVYVRSYGGWMLSVTSRLHAHLLTKELSRVRAAYNQTYHYGVGYDSPLKLLNRHNEVWYVAEGDPVCTDPQEPTPAHTPTPTQTDSPTRKPTDSPTRIPTDSPTRIPTDSPTRIPTDSPTRIPTDSPTRKPTDSPTRTLSDSASIMLSDSPSDTLSDSASIMLSDSPSHMLSDSPSDTPPDSAPLALSDPAPPTPSNSSADAPLNSSSLTPSDPPPPSPSHVASGAPSLSPSPSNPSTSPQTPVEAAANSTGPVPSSSVPSSSSSSAPLDPQADADVWNNTTHGTLGTQADGHSATEPASIH